MNEEKTIFSDAEQREIIENLRELNAYVKKQTSLKSIFLRGLIYGVGIVIGSTILAALLLSTLGYVMGDLPFVGPYIEMQQNEI